MNNIDSEEIISIFEKLNNHQIEYILLRNIDNELPNNLKEGKDIDLLIKKNSNYKKLHKLLNNEGYKKINHPHKDDIYLYSSDKFIFQYNQKNKIRLDLQTKILCRSLNLGEWLPLHQKIQDSAWENKKKYSTSRLNYWGLSYDDEFISLVVRSIFDKRKFIDGYIKKIIGIYPLIEHERVASKLELVFYKYTSSLLNKIKNHEFDSILEDYIKFRDY